MPKWSPLYEEVMSYDIDKDPEEITGLVLPKTREID
jgi:hypothetical protein